LSENVSDVIWRIDRKNRCGFSTRLDRRT